MDQKRDDYSVTSRRKPSIRNNPTTPTKGKSYNGSRKKRKESQNKAKRVVAGILAAGIVAGGITLISKMASDANSVTDPKDAIVMVDEHRQLLEEYPLMQQEQYNDELERVDKLNDAITVYAELRDKDDRTLDEESKYIEASRTICESKDLVIDIYTDTIKSKVAEAYGITNPENIKQIEVKDNITFDEGPEHNPIIELNNGTIISKTGKNKMDKNIAKAIINARHLRDVDYSAEMQLKDLPTDEIVSTYTNAMKFGLQYDFSLDKDGDLSTVEREDNDKSNDEYDR